ncbi:MAG: hypothetical protein ACK5PS_00585 [Desulfopila sp.]
MNERGKTSSWDGIERRRGPNSCRRRNPDRRQGRERRHDPRNGDPQPRRSLAAWLRSIFNARLGVDRRKGGDQRSRKRRNDRPRSILTKEELDALLK